MQFSSLLPLVPLFASLAAAAPVFKKHENDIQYYTKRNYMDYDASLIRGVNIGSLFVLEPYISPSLFEPFYDETKPAYEDGYSYGIPVDEWHYCEALGYDECANRLEAHWDSWYTEQDIVDMASMGINMIRLPIGYWAFQLMEGDPYVTGKQEYYFDRIIQWCGNNSINVWVDLHGAAGSQNGFDNSGLRDSYGKFQTEEYMNVTQSVMKYMLQKYSAEPYVDTVIGIELVNEPLGPILDMDLLKDYYQFGYDYTRNDLQSNQILIMHDAFQPFHYWDDFLTIDDGNYGIVIDHHHYQIFSNSEVQRDIDEHIEVACSWGTNIKNESHWNVAGEWAAALTDCAKWVNGVGFGARYDGSYVNGDTTSSYVGTCEGINDISTWSSEQIENQRKYIEAQLDAFDQRGGWIIWCYKTETLLEWDFQRLVYNGLFPQPIDDRKYPNQCGFD
ncbi:exo-1,3-beta-glucanase [Hanseniaspora osmophila]|uniref:glucan 1,3-beta-glucosidase n=1 Tax=Hanseniaspora osmophila TaxID=56408 RepID=A0A1E5REI8_9ASCO|nr:Glucan 1,3-beta-glucosidase [Hanseniaspora osmophila]